MSTNRIAAVLAASGLPPCCRPRPRGQADFRGPRWPTSRARTPSTRQDAAAELGKSRRREAIAPLSELVRDPEVKVRLEVVRALRELRDLDGGSGARDRARRRRGTRSARKPSAPWSRSTRSGSAAAR